MWLVPRDGFLSGIDREVLGVHLWCRAAGVVLVLGVVASACSNSSRLETLRAEPVLEPPPRAVELSRTETGGTSVGFGSSARVEVIWGIAGSPEDTAEWYVAEMGDLYGLDQQGTELRFIGRRTAGDIGVGVTVHALKSLSEVRWEADPADAAAWDGPVVVARASSG